MQVNLPARKYVDTKLEREFSPDAYTRAVGFFTDVVERVRTIPGAEAVGAINGLPLMGEIWGKNLTFYDRPLPADVRGLPSIQYRIVAGDYFRDARHSHPERTRVHGCRHGHRPEGRDRQPGTGQATLERAEPSRQDHLR